MVKNKKTRNKLLILTALTLLALLIFAGIYIYSNKNDKSDTTDVSLTPATEQEKADAEENKEAIVKQDDKLKDNTSNSSSNTNSDITVTITSATTNGVYAYIAGVLENGGICTATYSKGTVAFQKSSNGFMNVSNTQCEPIQTNRGDFSSPGTWIVRVTYNGSSSPVEGTSQIATIEVE